MKNLYLNYLLVFFIILFFSNVKNAYSQYSLDNEKSGNISDNQLVKGDHVWADLNNDGGHELVMTGAVTPEEYNISTYILAQDGVKIKEFEFGIVRGAVIARDFNDDGFIDVLMSGEYNENPKSFLLLNRKKKEWKIIEDPLASPLKSGDMAFIDLKGNGNKSLIVGGKNKENPDGVLLGYILNSRNEFVLKSPLFSNKIQFSHGEIIPVDYNRDGFMDIHVIGGDHNNDNYNNVLIKNIEEENNRRSLEIDQKLQPMANAQADWGDWDGNDWLDFVAVGRNEYNNAVTSLYTNNEGNLKKGNFGFEVPQIVGDIKFAYTDKDFDKALGLFLSGYNAEESESYTTYYDHSGNSTNFENSLTFTNKISFFHLAENNNADFLLHGRNSKNEYLTIMYRDNDSENPIPSAPDNLSHNVIDNDVELSWDPVTLVGNEYFFYNVSLVKIEDLQGNPVNDTILKPYSDGKSNKLKFIHKGNVQSPNKKYLRDLPNGEYKWRVQAIDPDYISSDFPEPLGFTVSYCKKEPQVDAGNDQILCVTEDTVQLNGSVQNAAGGVWSGGNGTFVPDREKLDASYIPTSTEKNSGSVELILSTKPGNTGCPVKKDSVRIDFKQRPAANAGSDITVCSDNPEISLNGSVSNASSHTWSGGNGSFDPDDQTLEATYIPANSEISEGNTLQLTLSATNNFCEVTATDNVNITFKLPPTVDAGNDISACNTNDIIEFEDANASGYDNIKWNGGNGDFDPDRTDVNPSYSPTGDEKNVDSIQFYLEGNKQNCPVVRDTMFLSFKDGVTPNIEIQANTTEPCEGDSVHFSLSDNTTGGGDAPQYRWLLNGNAVADSPQYSGIFNDGDIVECEMTSSLSCADPSTVLSQDITLNVQQNVTPSVSIGTDKTVIEESETVEFFADPVNGGSSPSYQWMINGSPVDGATGQNFTYNNFQKGDKVSVKLISSLPCVTSGEVVSDPVTIFVKPVLTSLSSGTGQPGDNITIEGRYFTSDRNNAEVKFGSSTAGINEISQDAISVSVPELSPGEYPVTVSISGHASSDTLSYRIKDEDAAPVINSISHDSANAGTQITVYGLNFDSDTSQNTITIGSEPVTHKVAAAFDSLVFQVPGNMAVGDHKISVTVDGNTGQSAEDITIYEITQPPVISGFDPDSAQSEESVIISGSHFSTNKEANEVLFGGNRAMVKKAFSDNLTVKVPSINPGEYELSVNVNNQSDTADQKFKVIQHSPEITGFNSDSVISRFSMTVYGNNFVSDTSAVDVKINNQNASILEASKDSILFIVPDIPDGDYPIEVSVFNKTTTSTEKVTVYTSENVNKMKINNVNPIEGRSGSKVTIEGNNFLGGHSVLVLFGSNVATVTEIRNDKLTVKVPDIKDGKYTVKAIKDNNTVTGNDPFKVYTFKITSFSPLKGKKDETVTVKGTNFPEDSVAILEFYNPETDKTTEAKIDFMDKNNIVSRVPDGLSGGKHKLVLKNENTRSKDTSKLSFNVIAPGIDSLSHEKIIKGNELTIYGKNLGNSPSVTIGGQPATMTRSDDTALTVVIPKGISAGQKTVSVSIDGENMNAPSNIKVFDQAFDLTPDSKFPEYIKIDPVNKLTLSINAKGNISPVDSVYFHYKGITSDADSMIYLPDPENDNVFEIPVTDFFIKNLLAGIQNNSIERLGYEYRFILKGKSGNRMEYPNSKRYVYLEHLNNAFKIKDLNHVSALNGKEPVTAYEMVAIPFSAVNDKLSVSNAFEEMGNYDKTQWRLFKWDKQSQEFVEYKENNKFTDFQPGEGYFFISRKKPGIETGGKVVKANKDSAYQIKLAKGWNFIGNPYNFVISWDKVKAANNQFSANLFGYENGSFEAKQILSRFEGGFVQVNSSKTIDIPVDAAGFNLRVSADKNGNPIDQEKWSVNIDVDNGVLSNKVSSFGMAPDALNEFDKKDHLTLPRFLKYIDINFPHQETEWGRLAADIKQTASSATWDFYVASNMDQSTKTLKWDNKHFGNNDKTILLEDIQAGKFIDMRNYDEYTFNYNTDSARFRLHYGNKKDVYKKNGLNTLRFNQPEPNPFNSSVVFSWNNSLEKGSKGKVLINIYNSLGKKVSTLTSENLKKGYNEITWQSNTDGGKEVTAGIYHYTFIYTNGTEIVERKRGKIIKY